MMRIRMTISCFAVPVAGLAFVCSDGWKPVWGQQLAVQVTEASPVEPIVVTRSDFEASPVVPKSAAQLSPVLGLFQSRDDRIPVSPPATSRGQNRTVGLSSTFDSSSPAVRRRHTQANPPHEEIREAMKKLQAAESDDAKEAAKAELSAVLASYFDADMKGREKVISDIEERVKKLRAQFDKRKAAKDKIIELQLQVLVNEVEGLGFFSRPSWNSQSDSTFSLGQRNRSSYYYWDTSRPPGASLEGIWSVVSMQEDGTKVPSSKAKTLRFVFSDNRLSMRILEQVIAESDYTTDATKQPPTIDLTLEGKPALGIYQLEGDDLRICLGRSTDKRPGEFAIEADSPSRTLITLKRGDIAPKGRRFFVMGADGTGRHLLAKLPKDMVTGSPDWSPDGNKIAFDCWRLARDESYPNGHVGVVNVDGSGFEDLGAGSMPSWSPDGRRLVFCKSSPGGLWVMNADGSNQKRINTDSGWGCDWSPTGNEIAIRVGGPAHIRIINPDTGEWRSVLETQQYQTVYWNFSWSPDGKSICFAGVRHDGTEEVAVVSAQGESEGFKVLLSTKDERFEAVNPIVAWDGNAKQILVSLRAKGSKYWQIYLLDPEGEIPPKRLPGQDAGLDCAEMAWSPDGEQVVFRPHELE
jgi:uncharacterized protein (TIGR03067 family)